MGIEVNRKISEEGKALLADPIMVKLLSPIAASVGVTTEEYLLRFESVLADMPEAIFNIFENKSDLFTM